MAFNLQTWREQCKVYLKDLKQRIADRKVDSIYGTIAAAAVWPVIAAFQHGDLSALVALGQVLAGVSSNLLAGGLQSWRDQAEVARDLQARIENEPALRDELDTIVEKLDAISLAKAELPEKERQWFVETLQEELRRLGNLQRFEASLRGVVVGGDMQQSLIVTGDNNSVTYIINQYSSKSKRRPDSITLRQQITNYLNWMTDRCCTIELRGIKREGQQVVQLDLESVYVPLEAETFEPEPLTDKRQLDEVRKSAGSRTIALNQVLTQGERVIITGGPGSGKTTVLLHLAFMLTKALAADDRALAQKQLGLKEALALPIFVPLSSYAAFLRQTPVVSNPRERTLATFISRYLIEKQTSFNLPPDFFEQLLLDGQVVLLLLDGLDEVPNEDERVRVREAIEELVTSRDQMRVVVTCRTAAYKDRTALGKGFREVRVKPLDDEHVEALVRQAYGHLYRHDPATRQKKTEELLQGIRNLEAQRQRRLGKRAERLVTSPLLVRMLIVVHFSERHMPEQRAELYMKATDAMLLPEYAPDEEVANRIGRLVGGSREIHRDLVQHLAFAMHSRGEIQGREISEDDLRRVLRQNPAYTPLLDDFIALTRLRGTLLEERLGVYRFLHLAFQEYLAARYLAEIKRSETGIEGIAAFLEAGRILESWWREPALLVAGYLTVTSPQTADIFLRRLAGVDEGAAQRNPKLAAEIQIMAVEVAASAFMEWQSSTSDMLLQLQKRFQILFQDGNFLSRARPSSRAMTGDTLARLGDPRPEVMTLAGMQLCRVPAGPFWMGSPKDDNFASTDEKPLHLNAHIDYDFWMSRYPVTVAQYKAFVEVSRHKPEVPDSLRDLPNRPVVNITWHEAVTFCGWLTKTWQQQKLLPKGWSVQLPSEAEWEKAARGGVTIPLQPVIKTIDNLMERVDTAMHDNSQPQRRYPWGNEPDPNRANYFDTGINGTSAMGCFPDGVSPYGCEEMSGNVWEWTRSLWGKNLSKPDFTYPYDQVDSRENLKARDDVLRVLRGGAFNYNAGDVRCAFHFSYSPILCYDYLGFRVAVLPL